MASCATTPPIQPASEGEIKAANQPLSRCLTDTIAQIDDGQSNPQTVASAAVSHCKPEFNGSFTVLSRHMNLGTKLEVYNILYADTVKHTTYLVLRYRQLLRQDQRAAPLPRY